ncbi:MAG: alpha-ribazole phosphatase [Chloroflexi bacterium]|nr:alpha-ribazole phosphatase [Chloroflexota bacterium]
MSRLFLVRHGITEFNSNRRFNGHTDAELSETGCRQAEKLRDRLATEHIDAIYASDLRRAVATAAVISSPHKLAVVPCPELREINYGSVEGLTFAEISESYPDVAAACTEWSVHLKFPGGESFDEFRRRVARFLETLQQYTPEQTILIVSHSGPLRVLLCQLLKIGLDCWWQVRFDNGSLSRVDTYARGAILSLLNDVSHLQSITS